MYARFLRLNLLPKTCLIMLFGWHQAGGHGISSLMRFLPAFLVVAVLWSGLYAYNHWTDVDDDARDPQYSCRPLVSGAISGQSAVAMVWTLVPAGIVAGFLHSPGLGIICTLMAASQIAYCAPAFRLKHVPVLDVALVAVVNPSLRFAAGFMTVMGGPGFPPLSLATIVFWHLGTTFSQKLINRDRDLRLGWPGTGTVLPAGILRALSAGCISLAVLSMAALAFAGRSGPLPGWLGSLPRGTLGVLGFLGLLVPVYVRILKRPQSLSHEQFRVWAWRVFALAALALGLLVLAYPR